MNTPNNMALVTGGAGFIGSHLVDLLLTQDYGVVVVDKLGYAGSMDNLTQAQRHPHFSFVQKDICDTATLHHLLHDHSISHVFHLAAESHVDNSISDAAPFIQSNIVGTYSVLEACLTYWQAQGQPQDFRLVHVSTDEVFGQLTSHAPPFSETSPYAPNSPYSASKAASDHLARAWFHTYGLPTVTTNCSNNYGPRQHQEKFIPTILQHLHRGQPIPIYGSGEHIRDWLHVNDHCQGLYLAATQGRPGETYCFGGNNEQTNLAIAQRLYELALEQGEIDPIPEHDRFRLVTDRPGHDWRYAIDYTKASTELGYRPCIDWTQGLRSTLTWFTHEAATQ